MVWFIRGLENVGGSGEWEILDSYGRHNKLPQTGSLKTTGIYSLTIMGSRWGEFNFFVAAGVYLNVLKVGYSSPISAFLVTLPPPCVCLSALL